MSTKLVSSCLLAIASLLFLARASHESAPPSPKHSQHQGQQQQQQLTISSGLTRAQNEESSNELVHYDEPTIGLAQTKLSSAASGGSAGPSRQAQGGKVVAESGSSDDSVEALLDENYLKPGASSQQTAGNQIELSAPLLREESLDKRNPLGALKSSLGKTRRQMEQQVKTADWWTKLVNDNKTKMTPGEAKSGARQSTTAPKSVIYQEQPLNQNALLTIRHQLMAIRDKHRMLMFRSVPQLMQLDQKLVDSYKLCLKRDMPLYAGMLYRTRDYVVRMANEIKHERQVLEAMAKQIQKVLRHKSTNSSLVRDYHRQLATQTSLPTHTPPSQAPSQQATLADSEPVVQHQRLSPSSPSSSYDAADYNSNEGNNEETSKRGSPVSSTFSKSSSSSSAPNELGNINEYAATAQRVSFYRSGALKDSQSDSNEELSRDEKQVSTAGLDDKSRSRFSKKFSRKSSGASSGDYRFGSHDEQQQTEDDRASARPGATKRHQRQKFYTVNVNEVNLKRELTKTQALIDRINSSSYDLMAVVDDIIYLFKLSSGDLNHKKGLSASGRTNKFDKLHGSNPMDHLGGMDNKKAKKMMMLKSPFKLFFERYGKLTMSSQLPSSPATPDGSSQMRSTTMGNMINSSGDSPMDYSNTNNNTPEIKPLFDPASFAPYKDPVDLELGFDAPVMLDTSDM